ncbi:MAG TPA: peptidylglycine monooxygenase [Paenalcaligenes sp.]|nr:peptidylglycine monooxygenase [Paenalcaligenes sp.]
MMNPHTVLLLGDQRFAVQWQWLDATAVPGISTVAVTNENEIVVACRQAPHIRIFDSQGGLLRSFSIEGMICPHHISIDQQQRLWVTDLDGHQIFGVDLEGSLLQHLGAADEPRWQAPFNHPTHAIFADDTLWVSDGYGNACVHRFDQHLEFIDSIGEHGRGEGQFSVPHMLVHANEHLYVADRENSRVQVFNAKDRSFAFAINRMYKPMAIAPYRDFGLLVSDQTAALLLFSLEGGLLGRCRVNAVYGHGMATDQQGCIYISTMLPDGLARLAPLD